MPTNRSLERARRACPEPMTGNTPSQNRLKLPAKVQDEKLHAGIEGELNRRVAVTRSTNKKPHPPPWGSIVVIN